MENCFWHEAIHVRCYHMTSEKQTSTFSYEWVPCSRLMFLPKITLKAGLNILKIIFHTSESHWIREDWRVQDSRGKKHGWVSQLCAATLTLGIVAESEDRSRAETLGSVEAEVLLEQRISRALRFCHAYLKRQLVQWEWKGREVDLSLCQAFPPEISENLKLGRAEGKK